MKKRFLLFFAIVFFFFFSGSATALFFSDTHHNNIWLDSHHPTHTWSFDLDDEMLNWGDISSGDVIDSVFLWFGTYDDRDGYESADILLNGFPAVANWEVDPGWWTLGNVSEFIGNDHILDVIFDRSFGDFGVSWVNLHGHYTENSPEAAAPVPEPTTLVLMGVGLVGVAGASRRKWIKRK
jgi:hypothetical protein